MSIGVVVAYNGPWTRVAELCLSTLWPYCERHGYELHVVTESMDPSRPFAWTKVRALQKYLPLHDWVWWVDVDTLIINPAERLEDRIDPAYNLIMTRDTNAVNTGSFLIQRSLWSINFLQRWWDTPSLNTWWGNGGFVRLYEEVDVAANVKLIEKTKLNSYVYEVDASQLLVHFANHYVAEAKLQLMARVVVQFGLRPALQVRTREELGTLFTRLCLTGVGAEVGVQRGEFSAILAATWGGHRLILTDSWLHRDESEYQSNANVSQESQDNNYGYVWTRFSRDLRIEIVRGLSPDTSVVVDDGELDWVYLDADHSYEAVMADLAAWVPKVRRGGIVAGHDYVDGMINGSDFGVKRAVDEFVAGLGVDLFVTEETYWKTWYFVKR